jgi:hypothetical protein
VVDGYDHDQFSKGMIAKLMVNGADDPDFSLVMGCLGLSPKFGLATMQTCNNNYWYPITLQPWGVTLCPCYLLKTEEDLCLERHEDGRT